MGIMLASALDLPLDTIIGEIADWTSPDIGGGPNMEAGPVEIPLF